MKKMTTTTNKREQQSTVIVTNNTTTNKNNNNVQDPAGMAQDKLATSLLSSSSLSRLKYYHCPRMKWGSFLPTIHEFEAQEFGVWMSIVNHHMWQCHHEALAQSVEDAWHGYLFSQAFKNVHSRLRVITCIVDDKGGNRRVESKRGKLFCDATIIDLTKDNDDDGNKN